MVPPIQVQPDDLNPEINYPTIKYRTNTGDMIFFIVEGFHGNVLPFLEKLGLEKHLDSLHPEATGFSRIKPGYNPETGDGIIVHFSGPKSTMFSQSSQFDYLQCHMLGQRFQEMHFDILTDEMLRRYH